MAEAAAHDEGLSLLEVDPREVVPNELLRYFLPVGALDDIDDGVAETGD